MHDILDELQMRRLQAMPTNLKLAELSTRLGKRQGLVCVADDGLRGHMLGALLALAFGPEDLRTQPIYLINFRRPRHEPLVELLLTRLPQLRVLTHMREIHAPSVLDGLLRASTSLYTTHLRNDRLRAILRGSLRIQLWHGVPSKTVGYAEAMRDDNPLSTKDFDGLVSFIHDTVDYDYVLAHRPEEVDLYARGFPSTETTFQSGINLRLATLYGLEQIGLTRSEPSEEVRVLYAPTYREERQDPSTYLPAVQRFCDYWSSQPNVKLEIKLHPADTLLLSELNVNRHHLVRNKADSLPMIANCDVLVTDYSSIRVDASLLGRRVVTFQPDREAYYQTRKLEDLSQFSDDTPIEKPEDLSAYLSKRPYPDVRKLWDAAGLDAFYSLLTVHHAARVK